MKWNNIVLLYKAIIWLYFEAVVAPFPKVNVVKLEKNSEVVDEDKVY